MNMIDSEVRIIPEHPLNIPDNHPQQAGLHVYMSRWKIGRMEKIHTEVMEEERRISIFVFLHHYGQGSTKRLNGK